MNRSIIPAVLVSLVVGQPARADVTSESVVSLEWVVDSSDYIVRATVNRENDPGSKTGQTRLRRTIRFLKNVDGSHVPAWFDISESVPAGSWKDVLLFGRKDSDGPTVRLIYCISLAAHDLPTKAVERTATLQNIVPTAESFPLRVGLNQTVDKCAAIDKLGNVLTDPQRVLEAVEARIRLKPAAYRNTAGLHRGSVEVLDDDDQVFHLFVPYDPEYRRGFLADLDSPYTWYRYGASIHLANYNDPEVIAALKQRLDDDGLAQLANSRGESTYSVRKAAFESLRSLGVEVPKPVLEPPPGTEQKLVTRPVPIAPWHDGVSAVIGSCDAGLAVCRSRTAGPPCGIRLRVPLCPRR